MICYYDNLLTKDNLQDIVNNAYRHYQRPLKTLPYGQAIVHNYYNEKGYIILSLLQSYNTLVAGYNFENDKVYCNGTYSQTTRKHISNFCNELNAHTSVNVNYYTFKNAIKN